jgi:hypothetical protein
LISHVTVTVPRHSLYGQRLEVLQLVSDRGPTWVTVRVPNGTRRNIKRALTDLAQPLSDSKSTQIVSIPVLLRILNFVETLSRRANEENGNDENDVSATTVQPAVAVAQAAGTDPAPTGDATCARPAPATARPRRG